MVPKASRGRGKARAGAAAATTAAPTRRSTRGQQQADVEIIDDIEGVLRHPRSTRGRGGTRGRNGRSNTGALRPPASASPATEAPPMDTQTNGNDPPTSGASAGGATAPIVDVIGGEEVIDERNAYQVAHGVPQAGLNDTEIKDDRNGGGSGETESGEKRPRTVGDGDEEEREPKRPRTEGESSENGDEEGGREKDKEGEDGNVNREKAGQEPNNAGSPNENNDEHSKGDAGSKDKDREKGDGDDGNKGPKKPESNDGGDNDENEADGPPRLPTPPPPPPADPCRDFRASLDHFRAAAAEAGIEVQERVEFGQNLFHQTIARAVAAVTEPMANNGGHIFSLPDPELSGTTPAQTALRPGHDVVWPYARGRPANGFVTRGGHLALFIFHAPTHDHPNVTVDNFDTTPSPAEVTASVTAAYHEARERILNSDWVTAVQQATAVIPNAPTNRRRFRQSGSWTCGLHALFSAWTYILGLRYPDDLTRTFGRPFYTAGVEIANLALQGQMDSQTIRNFLVCYGWIAPDSQVPVDRFVGRTQAFQSTTDLSRYIARARLTAQLDIVQVGQTEPPDLDAMMLAIGEVAGAPFTDAELPNLPVEDLQMRYISAVEALTAQAPPTTNGANETGSQAGAETTHGEAGGQSGGGNGRDGQTQNPGSSNSPLGPTGNGGNENGTNGARMNTAGTNNAGTTPTNPPGPPSPPPPGTSTTNPDPAALPESTSMAARFMPRFSNLPGLQDQDALRNYYTNLSAPRADPPSDNGGDSPPPPPRTLTGANTIGSQQTIAPATTGVLAGLHPGVIPGTPEFDVRQAEMRAAREASRAGREGEGDEDAAGLRSELFVAPERGGGGETGGPSDPPAPTTSVEEEQETDPAFRDYSIGGLDGDEETDPTLDENGAEAEVDDEDEDEGEEEFDEEWRGIFFAER